MGAVDGKGNCGRWKPFYSTYRINSAHIVPVRKVDGNKGYPAGKGRRRRKGEGREECPEAGRNARREGGMPGGREECPEGGKA
jgi:hypothetical protein